ncbi:MAG TPA: glutamate--cysteine ligase [Gammaproteobacteria bacterium]|nr:glutamate--cysteine ligase [Gammaproteobacteria bacterium]
MFETVEKRVGRILRDGHESVLAGSAIGLEKETLRVNAEGKIAQTPHPQQLGSPLTHPWITTDYSEALTEIITPPCDSAANALAFLRDTQVFVYGHLGEELLWATSMPCVVAGETSIPIAQYGSSNAGQMKTIYRRGLGYRYGRTMQVIAGVHFNYSMSPAFWSVYQSMEGDRQTPTEFRSSHYMGLVRNLQRLGWLVPYLFGASPAVCKSFLGGQPTQLDAFNDNTYYGPWATSLRMGDIGYQNNKEAEIGFKANYDSVHTYAASLEYAISTSCPEYEKIGLIVDGEYRQLNTNILQVENEYYSTIRPKHKPDGDERPALALMRGVDYVELRSLDVNAFAPLGIHESQLDFLEAFLVFCLLDDSPLISVNERHEIDNNELLAAHRGREPDLRLARNGRTITLRDWALEVCDGMEIVCDVLDRANDTDRYQRTLAQQREVIRDTEATPSARMLQEMRDNREGFFHFAWRMSKAHEAFFKQADLSPQRATFFSEAAARSRQRQAELEASDALSFEEYLRRYYEKPPVR